MKRLMILGLLFLASCTHAPDGSDPFAARDPLQPVNQAVFAFNRAADRAVVGPLAHAYHQLPHWSRDGISNALSNLTEPANALNGLLQLNPKIAFTAFWRFTLNSTFGFAGWRDFAGKNGLKSQDTDFGKTLGRYGVADGAYVMLPLAGPSTFRDTAGKVVDWFLDPVGWCETTPESVAQIAAQGVVDRDENDAVIEQFYYQSLNPYAATRAAYLQHQAFQ